MCCDLTFFDGGSWVLLGMITCTNSLWIISFMVVVWWFAFAKASQLICIGFAKAFGRTGGFAVGLIWLPVICFALIGLPNDIR